MKILFENTQMVVVEKDQNMPVQRDRHSHTSLLEEVKDYYEFAKGVENPYVALVHRLDRHTGGVVVFARTPRAARTLSALFAEHTVEKYYTALVLGPVKPEKGTLLHYLKSDADENFTTICDASDPEAKQAKLSYEVVKTYETALGLVCQLNIQLFTGRQHQIRAQLAHIGHPILGDEKYGSTIPNAKTTSMALWSHELRFKAFGKSYKFTSTPPEKGLWALK